MSRAEFEMQESGFDHERNLDKIERTKAREEANEDEVIEKEETFERIRTDALPGAESTGGAVEEMEEAR